MILSNCGQSSTKQNNKLKISADTICTDLKYEINESYESQKSIEKTDYEKQVLSSEFLTSRMFELTDTITADFNGDGKIDQAIYKKENQTSGIIITHGLTNEEVRIGFGEPFAHLTEFNWVDFWGLINDIETYEIVIEEAEIIGDRKVELDNPSIVLRKEEVGGGLITFKDGKYQWIHQAD